MRRLIEFLRRYEMLWMAILVIGVLIVALTLAGCGSRGPVVKPTPPLVTPCIAEPVARVPDEPARPKALTDAYVVAMVDWANELLGVITADRIAWRGERRCIRGLAEQEQIR